MVRGDLHYGRPSLRAPPAALSPNVKRSKFVRPPHFAGSAQQDPETGQLWDLDYAPDEMRWAESL